MIPRPEPTSRPTVSVAAATYINLYYTHVSMLVAAEKL